MLSVWSKRNKTITVSFIILLFICFLANFSQNDISGIVAEPKSTIEETMNNCEMLKRQKINNHRSQENCTTPKKNNGQCEYIILLYRYIVIINNWYF